MEAIINRLVESLSNGNILLSMVIVATAIAFNFKKIVDFFDDRKKAQITKLKDALENQHEDGLTKEHLRNALTTAHFKIATGIRLEKEFGEALIQAHNNAHGELSFIHFKRAIPHIIYKDKKLKVHISIFEKFVFYFNILASLSFVIMGLFFFALPSQIPNISWSQLGGMFAVGAVMLCTSVFLLMQIAPVISAKMVTKELKRQ